MHGHLRMRSARPPRTLAGRTLGMRSARANAAWIEMHTFESIVHFEPLSSTIEIRKPDHPRRSCAPWRVCGQGFEEAAFVLLPKKGSSKKGGSRL